MTKVYYDGDADLNLLKGVKVAIIGYGSQGHAQAQNLRDSGVDVVVAELEGTDNYKLAIEHGFKPVPAGQAASQAQIIQILAPDQTQAVLYKNEIKDHLTEGKTLVFSHGFNIHYVQIVPAANIDVIMVAPKGPGHLVRREFERGAGVPSLIAVRQDTRGRRRRRPLPMQRVSARPGQGSWRPPSRKRQRQTSSASRSCSAGVFQSLSGRGLIRSSRRAISRRSPTLNVSRTEAHR